MDVEDLSNDDVIRLYSLLYENKYRSIAELFYLMEFIDKIDSIDDCRQIRYRYKSIVRKNKIENI